MVSLYFPEVGSDELYGTLNRVGLVFLSYMMEDSVAMAISADGTKPQLKTEPCYFGLGERLHSEIEENVGRGG